MLLIIRVFFRLRAIADTPLLLQAMPPLLRYATSCCYAAYRFFTMLLLLMLYAAIYARPRAIYAPRFVSPFITLAALFLLLPATTLDADYADYRHARFAYCRLIVAMMLALLPLRHAEHAARRHVAMMMLEAAHAAARAFRDG